jgi:endonuclease/exonuclease/phosphatase (EEP) superfamily protein YafD
MFGATGVMVLFMKLNLDTQVQFVASNYTDQLDIQLINLDFIKADSLEVSNFLKVLDGDVLIFQGYIPSWSPRLNKVLKRQYPHKIRLDRIDLFGQSIYSKRPLLYADTLTFQDIPVLRLGLRLNNFDDIRIYSFTLPPALTRTYEAQQQKFINDVLLAYNTARPSIFLGNFNLTPWSDNLQFLKYKTDTKCSRIHRAKLNLIQENPFDYYPTHHMMYNKLLQNTYFDEIQFNSDYIGIRGSYQVRK